MDTLITPTPGTGIDLWWLAALLVATYELIVRFIPTVADYSVIGIIYRILDFLVENKAKVDSSEEAEAQKLKSQGKKVRPLFKIARLIRGK